MIGESHRSATSSRQSSRREFLKQSGTLAAASVLAGWTVPRVHAGENNTIKLALVGCGGRGTGAVADAFAVSEGPIKLHAMADVFEERVEGRHTLLQEQFGDRVDAPPERRFTGFDAFRKAIDTLGPGDVAILATHAYARPMQFEYAVEKGVHVFMEKSFAVDAPANRRLFQAAAASEEKGLKVGVGFMWRHCKARQEVIRRIHDGAIGEVQSLRIYRVHGPVHIEPLPDGANELMFQLQRPACFNWTSAGFLVDWHCHNIDVACWAKGAWPVAAQGMGGRCYAEAGNLFDHYTVEYTFPDGTKLYAFARHMPNCWQEYADFAHGTKGSAVLMTSLGAANTRIYDGQQMTDEHLAWRFGQPEPNPYHEEWRVLLEAIRQDKPHNEAQRAAEANLAGLMGRMATHSGQYVTWDEALNSDFEYLADVDHMNEETPAPVKAGPDGRYAAPLPGSTVAF